MCSSLATGMWVGECSCVWVPKIEWHRDAILSSSEAFADVPNGQVASSSTYNNGAIEIDLEFGFDYDKNRRHPVLGFSIS